MTRYVVGDSHVRSYAGPGSKNYAIFLGPGHFVNFLTTKNLISACIRLFLFNNLLNVSRKRDEVWLVVGNPDLRYYCYGKQQDFGYIENKPVTGLNITLKNITRYIRFAQFLGVPLAGIIGIGTPNVNMAKIANDFNKCLYKLCLDYSLSFFDAQKYLEKSEDTQKYIAHQVLRPEKLDMVHLNNYISKDFSLYLDDYDQKIKDHSCKIKENNMFLSIEYSHKFRSNIVEYGAIFRFLFYFLVGSEKW